MAKNFSLGKINLTGNPVSPGGGGGPSGYFTPEMMSVLGANAPTPELSGMQKFAQFFQNPQAQQALQGLAPLLFGAFGGAEMGAGALKTFNTQDAIRRQQEEIDAERRQREQALGISQRRLGLEEEELGARTAAGQAKLTGEQAEAKAKMMNDAITDFQTGLASVDTSNESALGAYARSIAEARGMSIADTQKFMNIAATRSKLPPAPKGDTGLTAKIAALESSLGRKLKPEEISQLGGIASKTDETRFQRIEIADPSSPGKPKIALFDPQAGQVFDPDTKQVIPNAVPFKSPGEQGEPLYLTVGPGGTPVYTRRSQAEGQPGVRTVFGPGGEVSLGGQPGLSTVAPPQLTAEQGQAVRGLQNLQYLMTDVMTQMQTQPTLGPVVGRLKLAEVDKLGGVGATPAEIKLATSLNNLITNKAFSEGGKQLTPTEQERFTKMLPSMSDTFQTAMIKLQLAYAFLNEQQANLYSTITPRTLGQYPGLQQPGAGAGPAAGELRYNSKTKKLEPVK